MKYLLLLVILILLVGCEPTARVANFPVLPPELKDCKVYEIYNGNQSITVMHCPNSVTSTSYRSGKMEKNMIVVDGIDYEQKGE